MECIVTDVCVAGTNDSHRWAAKGVLPAPALKGRIWMWEVEQLRVDFFFFFFFFFPPFLGGERGFVSKVLVQELAILFEGVLQQNSY